jgi:hypothetical protein
LFVHAKKGRSGISGRKEWCGRGELNPHEVAPAST